MLSANSHVREKRIGLEDHADVALVWPALRDVFAVHQDAARGGLFEAGGSCACVVVLPHPLGPAARRTRLALRQVNRGLRRLSGQRIAEAPKLQESHTMSPVNVCRKARLGRRVRPPADPQNETHSQPGEAKADDGEGGRLVGAILTPTEPCMAQTQATPAAPPE